MASLRDHIVRRLKEAGVRAIFGVPGGGGNLDLIDAASRAGLPFVLTATETGGALAAIGMAEVTGQPGACLTTLGPGAASVVNGVACALLDRAPLFVFTDGHAAASAGAFEHQQIDQPALFGPITKWSGRLLPGCAPQAIERAFAMMQQPPPGPVHLDCPEDFESAGTGDSPGRSASEPPPDPRGQEHLDREATAALVSRARRPVLIAGLGARRAEDAAAIRELIERCGLPALVTYKAKGVVPDAHPCFAGVFTNAEIERPLLAASDLIVGVGLDPVELLPRPWRYDAPAIGIGRWRAGDRQVPFAAQIVGDVAAGLAAVGAQLRHSSWDLAEIHRQADAQRRAIDIDDGFTAQRVVQLAARQLAGSWRVTVDAGAHMLPATMLWPATEPNGLLMSNGLSTMGFALPAAIGAAVADRGRRVVALTGDGGLLMCAAELLTAVRERLPICTIVFNDASLSLIEIKQQRRRYEPAGVALGDVDWPRVAGGFGVTAFAADTAAELERALERAAAIDGPTLIDARIDASNYARTLAAIRG